MNYNDLLNEAKKKTQIINENKMKKMEIPKETKNLIRYSLNIVFTFIILLTIFLVIGIYSLKNVVNPNFGATLKDIREVAPEVESQIGFFNGFVFILNEYENAIIAFSVIFIVLIFIVGILVNNKMKGKDK